MALRTTHTPLRPRRASRRASLYAALCVASSLALTACPTEPGTSPTRLPGDMDIRQEVDFGLPPGDMSDRPRDMQTGDMPGADMRETMDMASADMGADMQTGQDMGGVMTGCAQTPLTAAEQATPTGMFWGNLQHPPRLDVRAGEESEAVYGQVWVPGVTEPDGPAQGWRAEVLVGPLGTHPYTHGECWARVPAQFNVNVGNNDEHTARLRLSAPGLYGYLFRYTTDAGAPSILGDLDGVNDGASPDRAGVLTVAPAQPPTTLKVVTLNLRCQADDWPARRPLVLQALAAHDPDLIALQEDCAAPGERPQSHGLRADLAARTGRGYALRRAATHQADHGGQQFEEGITLLSAWPLTDAVAGGALDLPHEHFPRKALAQVADVGGVSIHVFATHWDYSAAAAPRRVESAQAILAALPAGARGVIMGDLNATPDSDEVKALAGATQDSWVVANPGDPGLTMPADAPTRRIDYIFAAGALDVAASALIDAHSGAVWLSDHRGVATTLTLR